MAQQSHTNPTLKYPRDLDSSTGEYPHRITFSALEKGGGSLGLVALYLPPDALKTAYNQAWGDTDMGAIGNAILQASAETKENLFQATSVADTLKGITGMKGGGAISAMIDAAKQGAAQSFRKKAAGMALGGESAVKAMEKVRGEIVNPHKALMYTGPGGFRTFSYNFSMVGKSSNEADEIAKIVRFFKLHMHPGLGNTPTIQQTGGPAGGAGTSGGGRASNIGSSLTLTYPAEWEIQMRVNKIARDDMAKQNILFKIDTCYLESCSVDYATGGNPAFFTDDGGSKPQTTTMALTFKETTIMTKEKVLQGF